MLWLKPSDYRMLFNHLKQRNSGVLMTYRSVTLPVVRPDQVRLLSILVKSPRGAWRWVATNIKYEREGFLIENDVWRCPAITIRRGCGDCVTKDTKVIAVEDGEYVIKTIGEIKEGDLVLSYDFTNQRYRINRVARKIFKGTKEVYRIKIRGGYEFYVTANHKLFVYSKSWKKPKYIEGVKTWSDYVLMRRYGVPNIITEDGKVRVMYTKDFIRDWNSLSAKWYRQLVGALKIPSLGKVVNNDLLFIEGLYVAEGWCDDGHTCIAVGNEEIKRMLVDRLEKLGIPYSVRERNTSSYVSIHKSWLKKHLKKLGRVAVEKHFLNHHLSLSEEQIRLLLHAYALGDGHFQRPYIMKKQGTLYRRKLIYYTSSPHLVTQLSFLHLVLGEPLTFYNRGKVGFAKHDTYALYNYDRQRNYEILPGVRNVPVREITLEGTEKVYDIEVERDHNFILADSGLIIHNCDDLSILLCSLLRAMGVEAYVRIAEVEYPFRAFHAWVIAYVDGEWIGMDATNPKLYGINVERHYRYKPIADFNESIAYVYNRELWERILKNAKIIC